MAKFYEKKEGFEQTFRALETSIRQTVSGTLARKKKKAQWNVLPGFVSFVKTSADKMVLLIFDIFSHDFSLFQPN